MPTPRPSANIIKFIVGSLLVLPGFAQAQDGSGDDSKDSVVFGTYMQVSLLGLIVNQDSDASSSADGTSKGSSTTGTYTPRVNPRLGLYVDYAGLRFSWSVPMPGNASLIGYSSGQGFHTQGPSTTYTDYQFSYFRDYWGIDVGWNQYRGFTGQFDTEVNGKDVSLDVPRPDLVKTGRYVNLLALPFGDDLQLDKGIQDKAKRGFHWSPVGLLGYDEEVLSGTDTIIPQVVQDTSGDHSTTATTATFQNYTAGIGGAVKYRKANWQVDSMLVVGGAVQHATVSPQPDSPLPKEIGAACLALKSDAEVMTGRWIWGASIDLNETTLGLGDYKIMSTVGTFTASLGYRL